MAYEIDGTKTQVRDSLDGSGQYTIPLPSGLVQDDVFIFAFEPDNGTISSVVGDNSGTWTQQYYDSWGNNFYVYYSIIGATPDTEVTITNSSSNQSFSFAGFAVRDADVSSGGANLIDNSTSSKASSSINHSAPALTPNSDDCLIVVAHGGGNGIGYRPREGMFVSANTENIFRTYTGLYTTYQETQASTGTTQTYMGNNSAIITHFHVFSIKNATSGSKSGYVDKSVRSHEYLHIMLAQGYTGHLGDNTRYDPTDSGTDEGIASLTNGGYTTVDCRYHNTASNLADATEFGIESLALALSTGADGDMVLSGFPITETYGSVDNYDLTNEKLIVNINVSGANIKPKEAIGVCFGLSDKTNAQFWQIGSINSVPDVSGGMFPTIIDVSDSTFYMDEIGTFNENSVGSIIIGHEPKSTFLYAQPAAISIMRYMTLVGGSSGVPCSFKTAYKVARSAVLNTILSQGGTAEGQYFIAHDMQVGGSDSLYWDCTNQSCEWPAAYNADTGYTNFKIGSAKLEFRIDASSGDTVNCSTGIFNFGNYHKFTIESTSHNSDIYTFTGRTILNATVTLQSLSNVDYGGLTFDSCKEITLNGADISGSATKGRVTISNGVDTNAIAALTGSTQAAIQALVDGLANVTFLNNTTAVRIEYTGATNITINFDAVTWTGNTTDIHFNATNAVSLTANMQNGANASTTAISGSATGVTISNDVTFTITVNVSGAEITFLNRGTQTEVYHVETGSTTQGYTYTYSSDVDLDIQVFKQGYKPYWNDQETLTSSNQTVNVVLEDEPASQI